MFAVFVAAGMCAGCGDSGENAATETAAGAESSEEDGAASFEQEAAAECEDFQSTVLAVLKPLNDQLEEHGISGDEFANDPELVQRTEDMLEERVLPKFRAFIDDLRQIEPPSEDADAVDAVLDAYEETYRRYKAEPISIIDPDGDVAIETAEQNYGLQVCPSA